MMPNYFIDKLDVILESLEDKAIRQVSALMGKKSHWENKHDFVDDKSGIAKYIESLSEFDPTGDRGNYLRYIVDQLKNATIKLPEDGLKLRDALKFYHDNKNKSQWKEADLPVDLWGPELKDWKKLENVVSKLDGKEFVTKRQEARGNKKGYELVFEIVLPNKHKTKFTIYKIIEPEAAVYMGLGTKWCTTTLSRNVEGQPGYVSDDSADPPAKSEFTYGDWHPKAGQTRKYMLMDGPKDSKGRSKGYANTAQSYLAKNPLYVVKRDDSSSDDKFDDLGRGGQLMQFEGKGFFDAMDKNNDELNLVGVPLDYALGKWAEEDSGAPMNAIKHLRSFCANDSYEGRPQGGLFSKDNRPWAR